MISVYTDLYVSVVRFALGSELSVLSVASKLLYDWSFEYLATIVEFQILHILQTVITDCNSYQQHL